jgi:2,3-bisphosphoglycerate-dependent phosphoglycerate mutase
MKTILFATLLLAAFFTATQAQDKTIVLVRHAERDNSVPNNPDPALTKEGVERAERLWKAVKKYKPHEIFSTDFKRTKQTVEHVALKRKKQVQTYDPTKSADLIAKMMASRTEHYLVVGHSNTIPVLANQLAKKEVFRQLLETEYGVIWVVRIRKGVLKNVEIFTY